MQIIHAFKLLWGKYPKHNQSIPYKIGVNFTKLSDPNQHNLDLFVGSPQLNKLGSVIDKLNAKFGKNTVYFAGSHNTNQNPMRIAFMHIPDLALEGAFKPESLL